MQKIFQKVTLFILILGFNDHCLFAFSTLHKLYKFGILSTFIGFFTYKPYSCDKIYYHGIHEKFILEQYLDALLKSSNYELYKQNNQGLFYRRKNEVAYFCVSNGSLIVSFAVQQRNSDVQPSEEFLHDQIFKFLNERKKAQVEPSCHQNVPFLVSGGRHGMFSCGNLAIEKGCPFFQCVQKNLKN